MLRDKGAEFGHAFRAGVAEAAARVAAFAPELGRRAGGTAA
jgi:hypothetical protein